MGQLADLFTALHTLNQTVHADLVAYRVRPDVAPDLPAIWNWLPDSDFKVSSTEHGTDDLTIAVRIGLNHRDAEERLDDLLTYADAFVAVYDRALWNDPPSGFGQQARRRGMRMVQDRFGDISVLAIEFPINVELLRTIRS